MKVQCNVQGNGEMLLSLEKLSSSPASLFPLSASNRYGKRPALSLPELALCPIT